MPMSPTPPPCFAAIIVSQEADIQRLHDVVNAACAKDIQHRIEIRKLRAILAQIGTPDNETDASEFPSLRLQKFSTTRD